LGERRKAAIIEEIRDNRRRSRQGLGKNLMIASGEITRRNQEKEPEKTAKETKKFWG